MLVLGAVAAVIAAFAIAAYDIPDERPKMQNIPRSRWQWVIVELPSALFVAALTLIVFAWALTAVLADELHEYSAGMIPPTPAEEADIAKWIPEKCCRTNHCCFKIPASALHPLSRDRWLVVATGKEIDRTGWSRDGQTWRCACDPTDKGWKVHLRADTRCIFPAATGY